MRIWQISDLLAAVDAERRAAAVDWSGTGWRDLAVETNGIANLNRLYGRPGDKVAVARLTVESDADAVKLLRFGYSDMVKVYVNGKLLYEGDNRQYSRNVTFLGTVGLYDGLHVPLHRGRNDIAFVVAEHSGGWAAEAQFDDPAGLHSTGL